MGINAVSEVWFVCFCRFVGHSTGPKTYYFEDDLACMEEALVCFSLDTLLKKYVSQIVCLLCCITEIYQ